MVGGENQEWPISDMEQLITNLAALSGVEPLLTPPKIQRDDPKEKSQKAKKDDGDEEEEGEREEEEEKDGEEEPNGEGEDAEGEGEGEKEEEEEDEEEAERRRLQEEAEKQKPAPEVFGEFDEEGKGTMGFDRIWQVFRQAYADRHLKPITFNEEEVWIFFFHFFEDAWLMLFSYHSLYSFIHNSSISPRPNLSLSLSLLYSSSPSSFSSSLPPFPATDASQSPPAAERAG